MYSDRTGFPQMTSGTPSGHTNSQGFAGIFPVSAWKSTLTGLSVTKTDTYEYEGMNPEYYTGLHRPYYADTAMSEHDAASTLTELSAAHSAKTQLQQYTYSPDHHNVASTYDTQMHEASEEVHAELPVRGHARKPNRSAAASQAHVDRLRAAAKKTAKSKSKSTAKAPVVPRAPSHRHAPKKAWKEEDPREHATSSHTIPHQGVLKPDNPKSAAPSNAIASNHLPHPAKLLTESSAPRARHAAVPAAQPRACLSKGEGGPCAVCYVTNSPQWRHGRMGGRWSGQPVCNTCGTWEGRHPDEPVRAKTLEVREVHLRAYLTARIAALGVNIAALREKTGDISDAASDGSATTAAPAHVGTSVPVSLKRIRTDSQPGDDEPATKRHRL